MGKNEDKLEKKDDILNKNVDQVPTTKKNTDSSIGKVISSYFPTTPVSLEEPAIDDDFHNLPFIERVTESIKYNVLCLEYSISPKGGLRQWIKINISLLLLLGIPIFIFVPLATYFMSDLENISELFTNVTQSLLEAFFNILKLTGVIILIGTIIYIVLKLITLRFGQKEGKSGNKGDCIDVTPKT